MNIYYLADALKIYANLTGIVGKEMIISYKRGPCFLLFLKISIKILILKVNCFCPMWSLSLKHASDGKYYTYIQANEMAFLFLFVSPEILDFP